MALCINAKGRSSLARRLLLAALVILPFGGASQALAAPVLDQQDTYADSSYKFGTTSFWDQLGQSFTASTSGPLSEIGLRLGLAGSDTSGSVTVEIRTTQNGFASTGTSEIKTQIPGSVGQIIATATISAASLVEVDPTRGQIPSFESITFATPATLTAGDTYSILLIGNGTSLFDLGQDVFGPGYSGGTGFARVGEDYGWSLTGIQGHISDFD